MEAGSIQSAENQTLEWPTVGLDHSNPRRPVKTPSAVAASARPAHWFQSSSSSPRML